MNRTILSIVALALLAGAALMSTIASAENLYTLASDGTLNKYDATTGALVNTSLISGLPNNIQGIAVSGSDLYVVSAGNWLVGSGGVGKYTTSGGVVNANLISGPNAPVAVAVSGSYLYVAESAVHRAIHKFTTSGALVTYGLVPDLYPDSTDQIAVSGSHLFAVIDYGEISEYDATTGAVINANLASGNSIAVSGSDLFVGNGSTIAEYDATTGAVINTNLASGSLIAVSGSDLFVGHNGTIGVYDATTGAVKNASLFSGLNGFVAVDEDAPVPEPLTLLAVGMGIAGLGGYIRRRRAAAK